MPLVRKAPRPPAPPKENRVIILTGPTYSGKSTTARFLAASDPRVQRPLRVHARRPKDHEQDGVDAHFRTKKVFLQEESAGLYAATWADRDGTPCAILRREIEGMSEGGCWVVVEVPIPAAMQMKVRGILGQWVCLVPRDLSQLRSRMRAADISPELADRLVLQAGEDLKLLNSFQILIDSEEGDPVLTAREVAERIGLDRTRVGADVPKLRTLYPHQVPALAWMKTRKHPALFMEMRLGKTVVTLRWLRWLSEKEGLRRVLVVAPSSTAMDWEANTKAEHAEWRRIRGQLHKRLAMVQEDPPPTGFRIYWINSEMLRQTTQLADIRWDAIICDESTMLRRPATEIGRVMRTHFVDTRHRVILAGDPMPEGIEDLWGQFSWLCAGSWMGYKRFARWRRRWFLPCDDRGWGWSPTKECFDRVQEELAQRAFTLSRKDARVGPGKNYERRLIPMHHKQLSAFRMARDEFARCVDGGIHEAMTKHAITRWLWLQRISGGMDAEGKHVLSDRKVVELQGLLLGDLRKEQVVVWFRFNAEIFLVQRYLEAAGIRCDAIYGEVVPDKREKIIHQFREGKTRVLLVQLAVLKHGLDLSCAQTAIYYSNSYSRETRSQTEDRIVHLGRAHSALIVDLVTENSTDGMILDALRDKGMSSQAFLAHARKWALIRSAKVRTGRAGDGTSQRSFVGWHG